MRTALVTGLRSHPTLAARSSSALDDAAFAGNETSSTANCFLVKCDRSGRRGRPLGRTDQPQTRDSRTGGLFVGAPAVECRA